MACTEAPAFWKRNSVGLRHGFAVNYPLPRQDGLARFFR